MDDTLTQLGLSRFDNWARWHRVGTYSILRGLWYRDVSSVVGRYSRVSDDLAGHADEDPVTDCPVPIDERDAITVEDVLLKIPAHLGHAVQYHYLGRVPPNCIIHYRRMHRDRLRELVEHAARILMMDRDMY